MPSLKFLIASEAHAIDKRSERLSLFNIVEELSPKRFPCRLQRLYVISSWEINPEDIGNDFQVKLTIHRPGADKNEDFHVNFTGEKNLRLVHQLGGLPLKEPGDITLNVSINTVNAGEFRIKVNPPGGTSDDGGLFRYLKAPASLPTEQPVKSAE